MNGVRFIRRTRTRNKVTGEGYFTFRLVRGERMAGKVRQITVLNLGRHFPLNQEHWPLLCMRIEQLLQGQDSLLVVECPESIERAALEEHLFGATQTELQGSAPQRCSASDCASQQAERNTRRKVGAVKPCSTQPPASASGCTSETRHGSSHRACCRRIRSCASSLSSATNAACASLQYT